MTAPIALAGDFPTVSEADWRNAASWPANDGAPRSPGLSDDGIPIGPIHPRAAGVEPVIGRAPGQRWRIVQWVTAPDAASALSLASEELAGGADGVELVFAESLHPLRGSTPAEAAAALAAGLADVLAEGAMLSIDAGARTNEVALAFLALVAERKPAFGLAFDPVAAAATGRLPVSEAGAMAGGLASLAARFNEATLVRADGRIWHAAGASEAQELAAVLATVIEHLRSFETSGIAPDDAAQHIGVALAADTDQFLTIAKFRAARLLMARALEAAGIAATLSVHAETAWRTMSRREPRMNVLRATGAAFAAAVGGADSITVLPCDALDGSPSAAARRLARNTQLVIAEECELYRFADPAAGSGAVEALTDALAERAWAKFQEIEAAGGILAALAAGTLQTAVAATREARLARVRERAVEMIGVNVFVNGKDAPPASDTDEQSAAGPLVFRRLAADAEALP